MLTNTHDEITKLSVVQLECKVHNITQISELAYDALIEIKVPYSRGSYNMHVPYISKQGVSNLILGTRAYVAYIRWMMIIR